MAEAGWHPDPHNAAQWRYWDGTQWTEYRAPRAVVAAPAQPTPGAEQWQRFTAWYTRGRGWTTKIVALTAVAALGVVFVGMVGIQMIRIATENPCDKYIHDRDAGLLSGIPQLDQFQKELDACQEWEMKTGDYSYNP